MRGEELTVVEALKVRVLPEGSRKHLLEFPRAYRDAVQLVVNELWGLKHEALHEEATQGVL